jgi:hypothetical protein
MKKYLLYYFYISIFCLGCYTSKNASSTAFIEITKNENSFKYISNYFLLSEKREIELWYNTYLNECQQFYKIQQPTKDSIINLIKSYWVSSDEQKHEITKIEQQNTKGNKSFWVTMNYSYRIISSNTKRNITNLKLEMILNKRSKVISIKEIGRG